MEYSIVNYTDVLHQEDLRFDADFYKPQYLIEDDQLSKYDIFQIEDVAYVTDGQHGYHEVDDNSNIFHLTAKNTKNWFADSVNADRLAKWVDDKNKRSSLKENDLLLSTRGTVGYCAIVKSDILPANIDQDVARIAINCEFIIQEYVLTYLNCRFGQDWLSRNTTGMVQQGLSLQKVRQIPIPILEFNFQRSIRDYVVDAYASIKKSEHCFTQAQSDIFFELGLTNGQSKHQLSFVKNYSDIKTAGRFDAEYFQPKYEEIIKAIKGYSGGWDVLGNITHLKDSNYVPKNNQLHKYIELANIEENGEITGCMIEAGKDLPTRARRLVSAGDVIVSSIKGSLSSIALIQKEYDKSLCSTGFYVIKSNVINSETLLVLLKSTLGQMQLKKGCSGTILTAINKDEINKIVLPKVDNEIQLEIQQKVTESFNLRKQSKHLLECAKRAVEIAIEQDEKNAIKWLDQEKETINAGL